VKFFALRNVLLSFTLLATLIAGANAQSRRGLPTTDELFRTISSLDTALFEAYNQCDLEKFGSFFAEDMEFYHDKSGVTRSRQNLVDSIKNYICGKVRREIVPGTLEVYVMEGYGAIEMGVHRFYELKGPNPKEPSGEAKFIHLWQNKDGKWKLARVISYDHGPAPK
jgi:hypothetical protein